MFLRTPFNYDRDQVSRETGLEFTKEDYEDCPVQQQFAKECDINEIVRRFGLTGELPLNERPPIVGDFTDVVDYHTALNAVRLAEIGFQGLPANVRARFDNDPGKMLDFLEDPGNREEAVKLGLVNPPAEPNKEPRKEEAPKGQ